MLTLLPALSRIPKLALTNVVLFSCLLFAPILSGQNITSEPMFKDSIASTHLHISPESYLNRALSLVFSDSIKAATINLYRGLEHIGNRDLVKTMHKLMHEILTEDEQIEYSTSSDKGLTLLKFWRKRDITPATMENERFIEHIRRIHYAQNNFSSKNEKGYDDRGMIYIQYGRPAKRITSRQIHIPDNEGWLYNDKRPFVVINFVRRSPKSEYRIVTCVEDFFPDVRKKFIDKPPLDLILKPREDLHHEYTRLYAQFENGSDINFGFLETSLIFFDEYKSWDKARSQLVIDKELQASFYTAMFKRKDYNVLEIYFAIPLKQRHLKHPSAGAFRDMRISSRVIDSNFNNPDIVDERISLTTPLKNDLDPDHYHGMIRISIPDDSIQCHLAISDEKSGSIFQTTVPAHVLSQSKGQLAISDIQLARNIETVPTTVKPNNQDHIKQNHFITPYSRTAIRQGSTIYLYSEVYNLLLDEHGHTQYNVSYTVKSQGSGFFAKFNPFRSKKPSISSSFKQNGKTTTEAIYFAIDLAQLKKGSYSIKIEISDALSGNTTSTHREISIINNDRAGTY
ncbi:GWxTD domain-containing protein [bacterium]|nr:GWxTD domain-containing protein [bacterium]